jgi:hypothetical protein
MKEQEKIYTQHVENSEWISKLKFYDDEISILTNRLSEIASKNNQSDVVAQIEQFQNKFILQKNNIDEIAHKINLNEEALMKEINANPVASDHRKTEYHASEKESVEWFENNFNLLRTDFKTFASKWM